MTLRSNVLQSVRKYVSEGSDGNVITSCIHLCNFILMYKALENYENKTILYVAVRLELSMYPGAYTAYSIPPARNGSGRPYVFRLGD